MCRRIAKGLKKHAKLMDDWVRPIEGKKRFTLQRANSFFVGVLLDNVTTTERAWNAADWIVESIGDEECGFWQSVATMKRENLEGFMQYGWGGNAFHIYWSKISGYLQRCAELMEKNYRGDPRIIWNGGRCVFEVRNRLEEFHGIGPNLSRMAVLLLVRNYGLLGGKKSLHKLDVKADILLKRVFERTGLVRSKAPDVDYWNAARRLNPEFPAALDPPAWDIGRKFCTVSDPNCRECPLDRYCSKTGL